MIVSFKFTMERHPYEKVISSVYYHARHKAKWDMEQELERVLEKGQYANYPLYCEDGRPLSADQARLPQRPAPRP